MAELCNLSFDSSLLGSVQFFVGILFFGMGFWGLG